MKNPKKNVTAFVFDNVLPQPWLSREIRKKRIHRRIIKIIKEIIEKELRSLGISGTPVLKTRQIHLLPSSTYRRIFGERTLGFHNPMTDGIYINVGGLSIVELIFLITHEIVHHKSFHRYIYDAISDELHWQRTGYANASIKNDNEYFDLLNEAITEAITNGVLLRNQVSIMKKLGVSESQWKIGHAYYAYPKSVSLLDDIVKRAADHSGYKAVEIWKKIKIGYFTGNMMHLRVIEKVLGRGFLRSLASLDIKIIETKEMSAILRFLERINH